MPECCDAKLLQVLFRQARKNRLVYLNAGTLNGAGVAVMVTCLSQGQRTFIEVVGTSQNSSAAEQARNRVRTITMGPAS